MVIEVWKLSGHKFDSTSKNIAVLPIGSFERHGDHLPLGTDSIIAIHIAENIAKALNAHLFPPIWYGTEVVMHRYPGTIGVDPKAFSEYIKSIFIEILRLSYKLLIVINGHGGNSLMLREVAREVSYMFDDRSIVILDWWEYAKDIREQLFKYPGHAGEDETSIMLFIAPEYVDINAMKDNVTEIQFRLSIFSPKIDKIIYSGAVQGRASIANAVKGQKLLDAIVRDVVNEINSLLNLLDTKT